MDASLSPKPSEKTSLFNWLDERLGMAEVLAFARHKTVPEHKHSLGVSHPSNGQLFQPATFQ